MAQAKVQVRSVTLAAGTLYECTNFSEENCTNLVTSAAKYAAKLLKKPDQCRMVQNCCPLFWPLDEAHKKAYSDDKRCIECLRRAIKIADVCMASSMHVQLFVEILNSYLVLFERRCPTIHAKCVRRVGCLFVHSLNPTTTVAGHLCAWYSCLSLCVTHTCDQR